MINLLAPEMKRQISAARINVTLLNYCLLISSTVVVVISVFGIATWLTMQDRAEAEHRKTQSEQTATGYAQVKQQAASFSKDLQQAKTILSSGISFYDFLTKIAALVPQGVILSNLTLGTTTLDTPITISAKARSYDDAVKLKNSLDNSPIFEAVTLVSATTNVANADSDPIGARYPVAVSLTAKVTKESANAEAKP